MQTSCTVLLVENNADDARLAELAFERAQLRHLLVCVEDGLLAMDYLKGRGKYADRQKFPPPQYILLDLGMPGLSGFEFLEQLRQDPDLRAVPVTILSGSNYSPDVKRAYELGVKSFLEKPSNLADFSAALRNMMEGLTGDTGSSAASGQPEQC